MNIHTLVHIQGYKVIKVISVSIEQYLIRFINKQYVITTLVLYKSFPSLTSFVALDIWKYGLYARIYIQVYFLILRYLCEISSSNLNQTMNLPDSVLKLGKPSKKHLYSLWNCMWHQSRHIGRVVIKTKQHSRQKLSSVENLAQIY